MDNLVFSQIDFGLLMPLLEDDDIKFIVYDLLGNPTEVKLADAVSAGRPGSRRDTLEVYIKRLQKLEEIATSYEGIKQSFAVQAGREVRVIVQPEKFDDAGSAKLARDISKRIEDELDYPGQIRVTVVRETRITEIAK